MSHLNTTIQTHINIDGNGCGNIQAPADIICFSDCRWKDSKVRTQELMQQFGKDFNIYFFEEPVFDASHGAYLAHNAKDHIDIAVPHLPQGTGTEESKTILKALLQEFMDMHGFNNEYIFWYTSPQAYAYSSDHTASLTIYDHDCMADLSFKAGRFNKDEQELVERADLVFTSSYTFYKAGKEKYPTLRYIPAYINKEHFAKARGFVAEAADQESLPFPRLGYAGAIDERLDMELIASIADAKPQWQIILTGPLVNIDEEAIPQRANIHYLGEKKFDELPAYITGWNAAILPVHTTANTSGISYKAAEYLAAGIPVIASPAEEIEEAFGNNNLVIKAADKNEFIDAGNTILFDNVIDAGWLQRADKFTKASTWNNIASTATNAIRQAKKQGAYLNRVA